MGWIDKVNKWLLKRIHPWAIERVKTDHEGTTLIRADGGSRFIRWSDVREIAVLKQADGGIPCPIGYFALHIHAVGSTLAIVAKLLVTCDGFVHGGARVNPALSGALLLRLYTDRRAVKTGRRAKINREVRLNDVVRRER